MTTNDPHSGAAPEQQYPADGAYDPYAGQPGPYAGQPANPYVTFGPHTGYPPPAGYAQYSGYGDYYAPPPPPHRKSGWRLGAGIAALTAAALVGGIAIGDAVSDDSSTVAGSGSDGSVTTPQTPGGSDGSGGTSDPGGNGGGTSTSVTLANAKQKVGVVTIVSTLRYQNSQSAGTGMILTSDGEVLTNNHVVNGATSIVVTVASTGKSYRADVVGTAPTEDVAVLQLRDASGLKTANLGDASDVWVGDQVVGVGNAGGTGPLRASSGKVTAVDQTITASDDGSGTNSEKLDGLIEVNAAIISGDSGGPLYDADGEVIGMDTAASANIRATQAYAIPIEDAVKVADQIESGEESSTVHIGLPAFLGVSIAPASSNGATVASLLDGGPAASAGVTPGSVITRVGDTAVTSGNGLKAAMQKHNPGDRVKITWTDASGTSQSATVTLAS